MEATVPPGCAAPAQQPALAAAEAPLNGTGGASSRQRPASETSSAAPTPPAAEAATAVSGDAPATSNSAAAKWKRGAKGALMYAQMASTVAQANKIGVAPEGWFGAAAMALQLHVAAEGKAGGSDAKARPEGAWEAPAGDLFVRARQAAGFTPARYYATLGAQDGQKESTLRLLGASNAAGKSGAFFLLAPDQQFIVKTCTRNEWILLLKILPDYVVHLESARGKLKERRGNSNVERANSLKSNSLKSGAFMEDPCVSSLQGFVDTLLPRYLGLYRFQAVADDPKPIRVVVMTNVFAGAVTILRRYDLKGSTHGRRASEKERSKPAPIFKDLDWQVKEPPLKLDYNSREMVKNVLKKDTDFLARHRLIDYSLLLGISEIADTALRRPAEGMLVTTVSDGPRFAYIGLVDVLTPYNAQKKAETFFLGHLFCGRNISCQPPLTYSRRFMNFIEDHVFHDKLAETNLEDESRSRTHDIEV